MEQRKVVGWGAVVLVLLTGCAGTITHMPEASPASWAASERAAGAFHAGKERQVGQGEEERLAVTDRVYSRVWPAALRVCRRMYANGCEEALESARRPTVLTHGEGHEVVNAYADTEGKVTVASGLLWASGNDDELAMVMAHEIGHVLYAHPQKGARNAGGGALLGGVLGLALGAALYTPGMDGDTIGDLGVAGMELGGHAGWVVYSPEMELEADRFAAFVVAEAGYDLEKAGNFFVRVAREQQHAAAHGKSFVSYFATHPPNDQRLAMWHEAMREIRAGHRAPRLLE